MAELEGLEAWAQIRQRAAEFHAGRHQARRALHPPARHRHPHLDAGRDRARADRLCAWPIIDAAAAAFGVPAIAVVSPDLGRAADVARARMVAAIAMRAGNGWSLERVGAVLNVQHSTIAHYARRGLALFAESEEFRLAVNSVAGVALSRGALAESGGTP